MTFLQAAEAVLRSAKRPLTAREITEIALREGLIKTAGRTPTATMAARLYTAAPATPIRREYKPGRSRATWGSVRWVYETSGRAGRPHS
jgi:hypothetical protein